MGMATDIMVADMEEIIMDINESNMKIKTFVINLKDSVERREAVLAETARYPFMDIELIEAVDGRKFTPEEIGECFDLKKFIDRYYRPAKGGEIGCTLSHRICYRKLLESEEEFVLILEDDVDFIHPEKLETILSDILDGCRDKKPHFITLAMHLLYYPEKCRKLNYYTLFRIYDAWGTCAYLINRQAAERLLSDAYPSIVADDFYFMRQRGIQVEGIYPNLAAGKSTRETVSTEIQDEQGIYKISTFKYIGLYCRIIYCQILLRLGKLSKRPFTLGVND